MPMGPAAKIRIRFFGAGAVALVALSMASCSSGTRGPSNSAAEDSWRGSGNLDSPGAAERHGCCGGRGGACGCSSGKVQCCDGTFSNRCGCE